MGKTETPSDLLEDEWYHVRHSGEIPEVALHSSIYYLTEDLEGPKVVLSGSDEKYLCSAAKERYREIIIRDIILENRDRSTYRGILRTMANWRRAKRFCQRHDLDVESLKKEVSSLLPVFLQGEIADVKSGRRESSIDCSYDDLISFGLELGLSFKDLECELRSLCRELS